jgi:hypothetical protein
VGCGQRFTTSPGMWPSNWPHSLPVTTLTRARYAGAPPGRCSSRSGSGPGRRRPSLRSLSTATATDWSRAWTRPVDGRILGWDLR